MKKRERRLFIEIPKILIETYRAKARAEEKACRTREAYREANVQWEESRTRAGSRLAEKIRIKLSLEGGQAMDSLRGINETWEEYIRTFNEEVIAKIEKEIAKKKDHLTSNARCDRIQPTIPQIVRCPPFFRPGGA